MTVTELNGSRVGPVSFDQLSFRYRRGPLALRGVTGAVSPTGITALVGPNGAGKTTLFNIFVTLKRPTQGSVEILGGNPQDWRERSRLRQRIGYLPQSFGYEPSFTVCEFVGYAAWLKKVPNSQHQSAVARALEATDLVEQRDTRMGRLSGGMLRRAGIAHAIVHEPKLLVLDEPTVGLDPQQRVRLRDTLRDLVQRSCIILSTHLIEDVAALAEMIIVLNQGMIAYHGGVQELIEQAMPDDAGDTMVEKGYSAVLRQANEADPRCYDR